MGGLRLARNLALVVAALVVSLLLLEGLCRLLPVPRYALTWLWDSVLGHRGPRSTLVDGIWFDSVWNQHGFRGDIYPTGYPGVSPVRVLILGDSFTEGPGIPWVYTYPKVLERALGRKLAREVEVITLAASDYGTANEFLAYQRYGWPYRPDIVLLQFFGGNDFINNSLAFAERNEGRSDFVRPYVIPEGERGYRVYRRAGGLQFTHLHPVRRFLRLRSVLFRRVEAAWVGWRWRGLDRRRPPASCQVETEVFLHEPDASWRSAFAVTERIARELKDLVEDRGRSTSRLLAFSAPGVPEVDPEVWREGIAPMLARCHPGQPFGQLQSEARFQQVFRQAGIETVSLRDAFEQAVRAKRALYLPDGHFAVEGHRLASELLADAVAARLADASGRRPVAETGAGAVTR